MKVNSATLGLLVVFGGVYASPNAHPTAAPVIKRQAALPPLTSLTNPAVLSSLSSYLDSEFSSLYSLEPSASSVIAAAQSSAASYLSLANGLLTMTDSQEASRSAQSIYSSVQAQLATQTASATQASQPPTPTETVAKSNAAIKVRGGREVVLVGALAVAAAMMI
ncbi:hypothetical protein ACQY0O_000358 [Thecaphora frezii]